MGTNVSYWYPKDSGVDDVERVSYYGNATSQFSTPVSTPTLECQRLIWTYVQMSVAVRLRSR